jgi:hypothetical protein
MAFWLEGATVDDMASRTACVVVSFLASVGLLLAPAAQARRAAPLTLMVDYSYTGDITVTLPSGQPVGVRSGTPTVIPAGYYNVELTQPGCVDTATLILSGPGVSIFDNLQNGEVVTDAVAANFQPNSTYTWRSGAVNPPVIFTFQTSGDIVGTPPPPSGKTIKGPTSTNPQTNSSLVGSASTAARGTLAGSVSPAGTAALAFKGKPLTILKAGRYTFTITDKSPAHGFVLRRPSHPPMNLTGGAFVGRHSTTVTLTKGQWYFAGGPNGKKSYFAVSG